MILFDIAKKESKEILREKRVWLLAIILILLSFVSMMVSLNYHHQLKQEAQQAQEKARQQWENQALKNPHSAAHEGTFVFKPTSALAFIDMGLDSYLGTSVFLEAHRQNDAQYKQIADQNDLGRFSQLTFAFILIYLFPLFIILIGFGIFTQEKERNTLRILIGQGVSFFHLALGKAFALWYVVVLFFIPLFVAGGILIFLFDAQNDIIFRYLILGLSLFLYYGIFIYTTVAVSAWSRSGNVSLVVLISFWIISALIIPKMISVAAQSIYPTPSALVYQAQLKEDLKKGIDGHNPFSTMAQQFKDSVLKANQVDSVHQLPFNYSGLIMQAGEEHETLVYENATNRLYKRYQEQINLYQNISFISPTILMHLFSMQLCQTDLYAHRDFTQQAEKYRIDLVRQLNYDLKDNSTYQDWSYVPKDSTFFKKTVTFSYQPLLLQQTNSTWFLPLLFLLIWSSMSAGIMIWTSNKIRVESR